MNPLNQFALTTAKEIVIAKMENSAVRANKDGGKDVADFFEEIYARVLALSKSER